MSTRILKNRPPFRKLRGYAFDPITSLDMDTAEINEIVYNVPWEEGLIPGPEGEYIKVIDRDPASNAVYAPVDLNDPALLAADGLAPSETNPQFHQQMVYAVIMLTIKNFEKAIGCKVMWSPVQKFDDKNKMTYDFVRQLYVYPHAIRDQNAFYSPERKALLFGYYNATPVNGGIFLPNGIVYSCLSHDIIAHETTHALLDGIYNHFMETTHPDVAGFHEGFADIIALLQHFTQPEIVKNQIRLVKGQLDAENLLSKLAVEFGQSTGEYRSLRDAIGKTVRGKWKKNIPSVTDYETNIECHDRGALLVAAVFDAFIAIYKNRTADLLRIATGGTGIVPAGDIHPDLVARLADEASKAASHVLIICIRALDYCPPIDLNYGDYLRALITADKELVPDDKHHYRIAFINAFRKRGIFPEGVPNLSTDTLCYNPFENDGEKAGFGGDIVEFLRKFKDHLAYLTNRNEIFEKTRDFIGGNIKKGIPGFHEYLFTKSGAARHAASFERSTGLVISAQYKSLGIPPSRTYGKDVPSISIKTLRLLNKNGPDGNHLNHIVMTLIQKCKVSVKEDRKGEKYFTPFKRNKEDMAGESMTFRGGCTLIFDLDELKLRHAITKPIFDTTKTRGKLQYNTKRLKMQYNCMLGNLVEDIGFAPKDDDDHHEPFAFIHQSKNPII